MPLPSEVYGDDRQGQGPGPAGKGKWKRGPRANPRPPAVETMGIEPISGCLQGSLAVPWNMRPPQCRVRESNPYLQVEVLESCPLDEHGSSKGPNATQAVPGASGRGSGLSAGDNRPGSPACLYCRPPAPRPEGVLSPGLEPGRLDGIGTSSRRVYQFPHESPSVATPGFEPGPFPLLRRTTLPVGLCGRGIPGHRSRTWQAVVMSRRWALAHPERKRPGRDSNPRPPP